MLRWLCCNASVSPLDGTGDWSKEGCKKNSTESTANKTVCLCDHLTHFGVLLVRPPCSCECVCPSCPHTPVTLTSWHGRRIHVTLCGSFHVFVVVMMVSIVALWPSLLFMCVSFIHVVVAVSLLRTSLRLRPPSMKRTTISWPSSATLAAGSPPSSLLPRCSRTSPSSESTVRLQYEPSSFQCLAIVSLHPCFPSMMSLFFGDKSESVC